MGTPTTFDEERFVIDADTDQRAAFIMRTYGHLTGAVLGFVGLLFILFGTGVAQQIVAPMIKLWPVALGAFVLVGWLASSIAEKAESMATQYLALAAYVVIEAIIFIPILYVANLRFPGVISSAAVATVAGFAGLTMVAFWTRKDFSFLGALLKFIGLLALGAIVCSWLFQFTLGTWFTVLMIALAGGAILYDTSNVLHHYPTNRHVAAALALFASVALLFWYVLRLFMSMRADD